MAIEATPHFDPTREHHSHTSLYGQEDLGALGSRGDTFAWRVGYTASMTPMLRRLGQLAVLTFTSALGSGSALGQNQATDSLPGIGSRLRVRVRNADSMAIGRLESVRGDTIELQSEVASSRSLIAIRDLASLEVFRRGSAAGKAGFIVGTLGAVVGGVAYHGWCRDYADACRENRLNSNPSDTGHYDHSASVLTAFVVGGAALGALIGYGLAPPQWEKIALPARLGILPSRRGVTVVASISADASRSAILGRTARLLSRDSWRTVWRRIR
jgi:hypothetical protein